MIVRSADNLWLYSVGEYQWVMPAKMQKKQKQQFAKNHDCHKSVSIRTSYSSTSQLRLETCLKKQEKY